MTDRDSDGSPSVREAGRIDGVPPPVHGGPGPGEAEPAVEIDFSSSVNAWGPPPGVLEAARGAELTRYPDPGAVAARRAVARVWDLEPDRVRVGAGATGLIHRTALALLEPGDRCVVAEPTFVEYRRAAALAGARVGEVRAPDRASLPAGRLSDALQGESPSVCFLCSPNSPTGEAWSEDLLRRVAGLLRPHGILVLDESFRAFSHGPRAGPTLAGAPNVLHVRSLTKELGVPGIRIGVAAGPGSLLRRLDAARVPWSVSAPAQEAARAGFRERALTALEEHVGRMRRERTRLRAALDARGWDVRPSAANFLMARVPRAADTRRRLLASGLRVRDCRSYGFDDRLRVAVRTREENDRLLAALDEISGATTPTGHTPKETDDE